MIQVKTYRGFIRNWRDLSRELDVDVTGQSRDARERMLFVAAYNQWGTDCGNHINGQFAIVLQDNASGTLFAARDILGAELLYYAYTNNNLVIGTTIQELLESDSTLASLNENVIPYFLSFNYVPGEQTLYEGIKKLAPGQYLIFEDGNLTIDSYWSLTYEPDESKTLEQWTEEIDETFEAALADIVEDGESLNSFLSGGVDSSYILAKSRSTRGICAGYANQNISEAAQALQTAELFKRDFLSIEITPEDFFGNVDEFLRAYEQPQADPAGLSLYCAAKKVAADPHHADVILSGEGADEFFAGYSNYANAGKFRPWVDSVYCGATYIMNECEQSRFLKDIKAQPSTHDFVIKRTASSKKYDALSQMLYTDMMTYFEGSILFNSVGISRGTGLDIRMPFCDLRIFDIARRVPSKFKYSESGNKIALRAAASKALPQEIAYRKKLGFPVPIRQWIADPKYNADIVRAFSSNAAEKFFNLEEIQELLDVLMGASATRHKWWFYRHKNSLWRYVWVIYIFIRWYELFF